MAITKKFTGRDWAYTLLDNPFMARVMEKKDFQAMTDEDWEWLISKDKQFAEIRAELKARFGGEPIKKVKSVKKRSVVKKASITRKSSAAKKKGAVKRKVAKKTVKKLRKGIKEPWQITEKEYDELMSIPGKNFKPTPATPKPDRWDETLFYDKYWSKLSNKEQKEIEQLGAIRDPGNKKIISYDIHKGIIVKALEEGKPVPPEVLKDYPDLIRKYKKTAKETRKQASKRTKPKTISMKPKVILRQVVSKSVSKIPSIVDIHKKSIPKRSQWPVLRNLMIKNGKMYSTDAQIEVITNVPAGYKDGMYKIKEKKIIPVRLSEEDYPVPSEEIQNPEKYKKYEIYFSISNDDIRRLLAMTANKKEENRVELQGINLQVNEYNKNKVYLASTDGVFLTWTEVGKSKEKFNVIIRRKAFEVLSLFKGNIIPIHVIITDKYTIIEVLYEDKNIKTTISSLNFEDDYPPIWSVFPDPNGYKKIYTYDPQEMIVALKELKPYLPEDPREWNIYINFEENKISGEENPLIDEKKEAKVRFNKETKKIGYKNIKYGVILMPIIPPEPSKSSEEWKKANIVFSYQRLLTITTNCYTRDDSYVYIAVSKKDGPVFFTEVV